MIKSIALSFALAPILPPAAALAEASGGYVGAPLPSLLAAPHLCDGAQGSTPFERQRLAQIPRGNAQAPTVSRSRCLTGMCAEGGGF